jgi:hypothetical protein
MSSELGMDTAGEGPGHAFELAPVASLAPAATTIPDTDHYGFGVRHLFLFRLQRPTSLRQLLGFVGVRGDSGCACPQCV